MKLLAFSVFDAAAVAYLPPFFMRSKGEAIRSFSAAANAADHQFASHADDYTLFEVGAFDDSTGELVALVPPKSLGCAIEYREKYPARDSQLDIEDAIKVVK